MKYKHDKNRFFPNETPSLIERLLCLIFRVRIIPQGLYIYLRRFYLTPRWSWLPYRIFLHHIFLSDSKRGTHDHPWAFRSFILSGGYKEIIQKNSFENYKGARHAIFTERTVNAGQTVLNEATHIHRLEIDKPMWTLMIVRKAKRVWGFHDQFQGFVPWRKYLSMEDEKLFPDYAEDVIK